MRAELPEYPWDALQPYRDRAAKHPHQLIDLSVGSPVDATPEFITRALQRSSDAHAYPTTAGDDALRQGIVDWFARRRGVMLDLNQVLPTVGSKELVALLPFLLGLDPDDAVVIPSVGYPTYEIGAALNRCQIVVEDEPERWPSHTKLIWLNSPSNPTGEVLDTAFLRRAVARARALGAVIVNDECYAELGWSAAYTDAATPCILHADVVGASTSGVLSVYSLSKQSNLAGYRAGVIAGDADLISTLLRARKHAGLMLPTPVQAAMTAALADDAHVREQKERYRERREALLSALTAAGFRVDQSEAGLYLWVTRGEPCWSTVQFFAERGILVAPGEFYGAAANDHVRIALTAPTAAIHEAAERLA